MAQRLNPVIGRLEYRKPQEQDEYSIRMFPSPESKVVYVLNVVGDSARLTKSTKNAGNSIVLCVDNITAAATMFGAFKSEDGKDVLYGSKHDILGRISANVNEVKAVSAMIKKASSQRSLYALNGLKTVVGKAAETLGIEACF